MVMASTRSGMHSPGLRLGTIAVGCAAVHRIPGLLDGERHGEGRALARHAVGCDRAAVPVDDLAAERESDPGPAVGPAAVEALEDLEDPRRVPWIEADPVD